MASSINASTSGAGGVITTADNSGVLNIQTAGSTAINITSGQFVNIGTTTSAAQLTVKAASGQGAALNLLTTDVGANSQVVFTGNRTYQIGTGNSGSGFADVLYFYDGTAGAERMRLDSSGNFQLGYGIGPATAGAPSGMSLSCPANSQLQIYLLKNTQIETHIGYKSGSDGNFYIGTGGGVNGVGSYGTYQVNLANSWSSVSDETLKTDLSPILDGLNKVASLRAVTGRYIHDDADKSRSFLIAQDVQKVLPEAVSIADPEKGTLGLSYTDVIPLLVAAIKELKAEVDALKAGA